MNAILSFTSFLAVYSTVFFVSDTNNFKPNFNVIDGLSGPEPYLYVGNISVNNTGLFYFNNFTVDFTLSEPNGTLITYTKFFDEIAPQHVKVFEINLTAPYATFNTTMDYTAIQWDEISGFLMIKGKYAFALFDFQMNITVDPDWFI
nr:hypothetical protein [Candidatus Sigynarchaeota archaeon]